VDGLARRLPPRHGELIRLHYLEADAAEMRRCGERMGLRPGRTSQIHTEAIELLRESLGYRRD
jgi:DNA-directed RNA polymerase specialized sigma subunit